MKERLVWLDALKGIGILSIMRIHMVQPMEVLQSWIYVGAVAMFFVLAGFNLSFPQNTKESIIGKAKRLLIPYFVYSLLLLVVEHHLGNDTLIQIGGVLYGRASIGKEVGSQGLMLLGNAPMWFLLCMFLTYLWVYLIYCKCRTNICKIFCITLFVIASACLYFVPIRLPWSLDTSFIFAALLCIGYEFRNYYLYTNKTYVIIAFVVWLLLFYTAGGYNISIGDYGKFGVFSVLPFMLVVLAETYSLSGFLQIIEKTRITMTLAYIGRQSLRLMCIHLVIYVKVNAILSSHFASLYDNKWMILLISLCVILIVNACLDLAIQRSKNKFAICRYL